MIQDKNEGGEGDKENMDEEQDKRHFIIRNNEGKICTKRKASKSLGPKKKLKKSKKQTLS